MAPRVCPDFVKNGADGNGRRISHKNTARKKKPARGGLAAAGERPCGFSAA
ncbi:hypothetical protein BSIN_1723 [Burkholderia singularis]|uniref:Uncharacterized protein n=1 Tax=Burkholderia singularis TaxID=1503053 RepID=A0A238GZM1_9BURK|nr:hypothetical protein BSIN_1723 [Burkholderia singularis]